MSDTDTDAAAAAAKQNADGIKDEEATERGARGAAVTERPGPTDIAMPPLHPH